MDALYAITLTLMPVLLAALGYVSLRAERWIKARTHLEMEAYHREALDAALKTGAQIILGRISGDPAATAAAKSALLAEIVAYARRSVPDAIDYLGASFEILLDKAEAKLAVESGVTVR